MFERFTKPARETVKAARAIAVADHAPTVEAEHLLLALATKDRGIAEVMQQLGLSEPRVRDALDIEFTDALAAVGVIITAPPTRSRRGDSSPAFGQSAKLALERTLKSALNRNDKQLDDRHILLALAGAEAGVVPRVLRSLDVSLESVNEAIAHRAAS